MSGRYTPPKKQPGAGGPDPRRNGRGVPADETPEERATRRKKERQSRRIAIFFVFVILVANVAIATLAYSNPLTLVAAAVMLRPGLHRL